MPRRLPHCLVIHPRVLGVLHPDGVTLVVQHLGACGWCPVLVFSPGIDKRGLPLQLPSFRALHRHHVSIYLPKQLGPVPEAATEGIIRPHLITRAFKQRNERFSRRTNTRRGRIHRLRTGRV